MSELPTKEIARRKAAKAAADARAERLARAEEARVAQLFADLGIEPEMEILASDAPAFVTRISRKLREHGIGAPVVAVLRGGSDVARVRIGAPEDLD